MGEFVNKIIPLYIDIVNEVKEGEKSDDLFDLIENCLNTINMLLIRCLKSSHDYLDKILTFTQVMLEYDPNYIGDYETIDEEESDEGGWDAGSEPDIAVDDNSWKVRKAASLLLDTVISTHTGSFKIIYNEVADLLIKRINERDSDVKNCIIKTMSSLLKTIKPSSELESPGFTRTLTIDVTKVNVPIEIARSESVNNFREKISSVIETISKQFKGKLTKENRYEIILMIRIMSTVLPNTTAEQ